MINFEQFYTDATDLYWKYRDDCPEDDWEQKYFDAMEDRYTTPDYDCNIHLFYADDEGIGEVAQGLLDDLLGKTLVHATCFNDEYRDTTIAVMLTKRMNDGN